MQINLEDFYKNLHFAKRKGHFQPLSLLLIQMVNRYVDTRDNE